MPCLQDSTLAPALSGFATPETRPRKLKKNPEVDNLPRRSSLRLRGIKVDSDCHEQDRQTMLTVEGGKQGKPPRKGGDFSLADMLGDDGIGEDGCGDLAGALRLASSLPSPSRRREKKEGDEDTTEHEMLDTTLCGRLAKLSLRHAPVKVTPQRIYTQAFHSSPEQRLLAAGDKAGYLGFLKLGCEGADPQVWAIKPHTQTISRVLFSPADAGVLFTSSYDGSVRQLDLVTSKSTEAFTFVEHAGLRLTADFDDEDDCLITCVDVPRDSPNTLWFSDTSGRVGRRDMRARAGGTSMFRLSEKKVGCVSVTNDGRHVLTSSLDKMMRIWDVRCLSSVRTDDGKEETSGIQGATWEWKHDLSVTAAYWSPSNNRVVSTSYDDKLRVFEDPRGKAELGKPICIPHDNQTGR
ncbi:MAG: WD40-repeat-containing domain protein [Olpidium bornovanus]|uniref:DNA damage-binding protein CMR1 n=1 Tax=Olpidium bornovanus TaxID=278681 RepID=A0A8H8A0A3_9FUNG|nr:MAG: WD40-repeat-containing domain protein [Olpidium bornovanus]